MAIARKIRADKIDILAIQYMDISKPKLTQIQYDEAFQSVNIHYRCLDNWCEKNLETDSRQKLFNLLKQAADDGLVDYSALETLLTDPTAMAGMFLFIFIIIQKKMQLDVDMSPSTLIEKPRKASCST